MSDSRFPPNHHVPLLTVFGDPDMRPWFSPDEQDAEVRAAGIQDQAARFVRIFMKAHKLSQAQFATEIGMDHPKLSRLLTGAMWASLIDLETILGGCGTTLTSISLAVGDGSHQSPRVKRIISSYLREQLAKVEEETAHIEQGRPST